MKIISTNIGSEKTITWKDESITTGIYKMPVDTPITLGTFEVNGDHINNKKVHGGIDKACYSYGENYYGYWKNLYPDLDWTYGMFGENLTISDMDESEILIGDIFKVGGAIIQVSQPRQPCNKFAARFRATEAIKQFIDFDHPGVYFRVLQPGNVRVGDKLQLDLRNEKALSVQQIYQLVYSKRDKVNGEMAREALFDPNLSPSTKKDIQRHWKV
jgi:MOSC domain-containing protein YiiM